MALIIGTRSADRVACKSLTRGSPKSPTVRHLFAVLGELANLANLANWRQFANSGPVRQQFANSSPTPLSGVYAAQRQFAKQFAKFANSLANRPPAVGSHDGSGTLRFVVHMAALGGTWYFFAFPVSISSFAARSMVRCAWPASFAAARTSGFSCHSPSDM